MTGEGTYLRWQAHYIGRVGVEVGIFVAVDHLRRAGRLSVAEESIYFDVDDWFLEHLPNPPFYADGNTVGAVTWFKAGVADEMLERLSPLTGMLTAHGVRHELVGSADPGAIIYEDCFQVGVVPRARKPVTPRPPGLVLGPTTSGSKRHLAGLRPLEPQSWPPAQVRG